MPPPVAVPPVGDCVPLGYQPWQGLVIEMQAPSHCHWFDGQADQPPPVDEQLVSLVGLQTPLQEYWPEGQLTGHEPL